jgi:hypothetical protein
MLKRKQLTFRTGKGELDTRLANGFEVPTRQTPYIKKHYKQTYKQTSRP